VTQNGCCLYRRCTFLRSPYRPQQAVCSRPECQRRRRADYHRRKLEADPEYRQIAHDSQKKWREAHPDYLPHYRAEIQNYDSLLRRKARTPLVCLPQLQSMRISLQTLLEIENMRNPGVRPPCPQRKRDAWSL